MPSTIRRRQRTWNHWEAFRAAAIVVLVAFLMYRIFFQRATPEPLRTPLASMQVDAVLPQEVAHRLLEVGWDERVGDRLRVP